MCVHTLLHIHTFIDLVGKRASSVTKSTRLYTYFFKNFTLFWCFYARLFCSQVLAVCLSFALRLYQTVKRLFELCCEYACVSALGTHTIKQANNFFFLGYIALAHDFIQRVIVPMRTKLSSLAYHVIYIDIFTTVCTFNKNI